jgi:hypothetical protein
VSEACVLVMKPNQLPGGRAIGPGNAPHKTQNKKHNTLAWRAVPTNNVLKTPSWLAASLVPSL